MFCPECGTWNRATAATCASCVAPLPVDLPVSADPPDAHIGALRQATGNRYHIIRRLGSGGMADVYLARHARLHRQLAVKVLHVHLARDTEMRERFRREAEAASRLVHPAICSILDAGDAGELVWIVMPFLAGGSLADQLARTRTVPAARVALVTAQLASGLDHAHRHGIVHRDVKPDNVLFDEDGFALLTDFGIATAKFHARLTAQGRAMGTPHYMSPEQAMGKLADGRSDLYALGVLMYESLAGSPPFDGGDAYSIGYKHVHEKPTALSDVEPSVPLPLSSIVMRCLSKRPEERYGRGNDLADALLAWLAADPDARHTRAATMAQKLDSASATR
ncbi:MAG TPA: serine/threonine-protein kinase [Gemmatimonadaceae bacterium]|nr:serine/threonine-protein kinase [Gemmatimonadaceae bacterium]